KELFLPRTQVMATADLTDNLSGSAQYFLEFRANRFPDGGTYLAPFDILYSGPTSGGAVGGRFGGAVSAGQGFAPDDISDGFGLKAEWAPAWAKGGLGLWYRAFDEVQRWPRGSMSGGGGRQVRRS